ncbi:MAG: HAD hydrolase family protein [Roseburia sp.]|nr:HAD hydrolase family protein [Roseburia sp.]
MDSRWSNIKLIISDFDGVMTDNRVLVDEAGKESVFVSRADGQAIHILRSMGIDLAIISTETNSVVRKRAEKLKVECIQSVSDKAACLKNYSIEKNIPLQNIAYIGNDINDYDAMLLVGLKIAPNDAYKVVKDIADYVTTAKGGYGVIREIAEILGI